MYAQRAYSNEIRVPAGAVELEGELIIPAGATGIVIFAHGSGSSRFSPRNKFVAEKIRDRGVGTLLFDLLTPDEEAIDQYTRHLRFDIGMLAGRLEAAARWLLTTEEGQGRSIGFFGSSTGGAAALVAAARIGNRTGAVVSRGGRPDLAADALSRVTAPTLLIVGEFDDVVIKLNREAFDRLTCEKHMEIIPGATHLFEEPGTLEKVADIAAAWFSGHLIPAVD